MKYLESVGTFIDENGITYPALENNTPDLENPIEIETIEQGDWTEALSEEDLDYIINEFNSADINF
jgi:hypothetical protein